MTTTNDRVHRDRGLPRAADMEASGPAPLRGLADEHTRNAFGVPWSLPSGGITGDLGRPRSRGIAPNIPAEPRPNSGHSLQTMVGTKK